MKTLALKELSYVIFDLETTGLYPESGDEIIEIGALIVDKMEVTTQVFHSMVNPGRPIPASSSAINGIKNEDVKNAPIIQKILPEFLDFAGGRILVAQNAKFDLGFVVSKLKQMNTPMRQSIVVDTIGISKILFPYETSHNLDVIMSRLQIARTGERHRSLDDCRYTAQVLIEFLKLLEQQGIQTLPEIESSFVKAENLRKAEKPKTMSLFGGGLRS